MLEEITKAKKGIMCSRMFSKDVLSYDELRQAVSTYAVRAAEKLRGQQSLTCEISVFIRTNDFKQELPHYSASRSIRLSLPTAFTPDIIKKAMELLTNMYIGGYQYKKAGVFLSRITSQAVLQPDLFGEFSFETYAKQMRLSYTVDAINEAYGRDTLFYLVQGIQRDWKMKQLHLSKRYTTRWNEILTTQ